MGVRQSPHKRRVAGADSSSHWRASERLTSDVEPRHGGGSGPGLSGKVRGIAEGFSQVIECLATNAELVAEGVERAIPGLITAAMTASLRDDEVRLWLSCYWPKNMAWPEEFVQAVRQGGHEKWVLDLFRRKLRAQYQAPESRPAKA